MINAIKDIGAYLKANTDINEIDIIRSLVNKITGDSIKEIFFINIKDDNTIETHSEEFYDDITTKALFYQAGNGALGGALRVDFLKEDKPGEDTEKTKFKKKIETTLTYCNLKDYSDIVEEKIYSRIKEVGKTFLVVILINDKYPIDLFKDKFLEKMYSTMFKSINGKHICHFCGEKTEVFNTTTYKFYTNDKEVYGNIHEKNKSGITICKNCLNDVLISKEYVEDKLTTYWLGKNVMFLPHNFNEITEGIYESSTLCSEDKKNFLANLSSHEESVLELLGKGNTETDIIFFEKEGNKTFFIYHTIKSMLPSRFGELAKLLKHYKLKLFNIIKFTTTIKVGLKGPETTDKEKFKIIESIFTGRKVDRNLFFARAMMVYKYHYVNSKTLKEDYKFMIKNIGKVYNFLVDSGCLKGGFDVMKQYSDFNELFENNESYFDSNEKKAWFLIGHAYDYINYMIKKNNSTEEGKLADRTSLDKNFFFARKFDFKDFIYFSNLLSDKMIKYRLSNNKLKNILTEAKELMANPNGKISSDEAKYIFFWGMDSYFKKDEDTIKTENKVLNENISE